MHGEILRSLLSHSPLKRPCGEFSIVFSGPDRLTVVMARAVVVLLLLPLTCHGQFVAPRVPWQQPPVFPQSPAVPGVRSPPAPPNAWAGTGTSLQSGPFLPVLPSLQQHLAWGGGQWVGQNGGPWGVQPRQDPRREALVTAWNLLNNNRRETMVLGISLAFMTGRFNVLLCPLVLRDLWPVPVTSAPEAAVLECLSAPSCSAIRQMSLPLCQSRRGSCALVMQLSHVCQLLHAQTVQGPAPPPQAPFPPVPLPRREPPLPPMRPPGSRPLPPGRPVLPPPTPALPIWTQPPAPPATTTTTPTTTPTTPTTTIASTPAVTTTSPTTTTDTTTVTTTDTTTVTTTDTTTGTTTDTTTGTTTDTTTGTTTETTTTATDTTTTTGSTSTASSTAQPETTTAKFWSCNDVNDLLNCSFETGSCKWKSNWGTKSGSAIEDADRTNAYATAAPGSVTIDYEMVSPPFAVSDPMCFFIYSIHYEKYVANDDISIAAFRQEGGTDSWTVELHDPQDWSKPATKWARREVLLMQIDEPVQIRIRKTVSPSDGEIGLDWFIVSDSD